MSEVVALHVPCPLRNFYFAKNAQILKYFKCSIIRISTMSSLLSSLEKHVSSTLEHEAQLCDCVYCLNSLNMLKMHTLIA